MARNPEDEPEIRRPTGFWPRHGCAVVVLTPLAISVPVWLLCYPDSYGRALGFTLDALVTLAWVSITAQLTHAAIVDRANVRRIGFVITAGLVALTGAVIWNLAALYFGTETDPITLFGWGYSARPLASIWLMVLGISAHLHVLSTIDQSQWRY